MLTERARLHDAGVTAAGFTDTGEGQSSSDAGTRLYMAPEVIEGKPSTMGADVYALGVMLYQMAVGDLTKALAPGWDRDVTDEVLREDISAAVDGAPDRRASAAQVAERLLTQGERQAARAAEHELADRVHHEEQTVRRRRNWVTAVLCGLLLLGLGLGFAFERAESSARQALIDQTLRSNEAMVRWPPPLSGTTRGGHPSGHGGGFQSRASRPVHDDRRTARRSERARAAVQRHLEQVLLRGEAQGFASWAVADSEAVVWARAPSDPGVVGGNYKYREWFNGRRELPRDTANAACHALRQGSREPLRRPPGTPRC